MPGTRKAATSLVTVFERAKRAFRGVDLGPDVFVYHPLDYAWPLAKAYAERYGDGPKEVVFVGMNPGPYGMGQTGVPFGEVAAVRDWMKLEGVVKPPKLQHPKRLIEGLDCKRSEVSGRRLWGAFASKHPKAQSFFARAMVINYCPLLFLDEKGANVTPDKIKREQREEIEAKSDALLRETLTVLSPKVAVGIGQYAAQRIARVTGEHAPSILHPSPASPAANRGWAQAAASELEALGLHGFV